MTEYDALFLDVSMEQVNGIELASWIREKSDSVLIVFISGYMSYVFDGYKVGAARYILKNEVPEEWEHYAEWYKELYGRRPVPAELKTA